MMWSCESSSKASCLLQFNWRCLGFEARSGYCMSIRRRAHPCAAICVHVPACVSMCSLCCNVRPCVGLLTTQFLVQCWRLVFETLSNSVSCVSMRWSVWPLAGMRVHTARPCATIRVHALQCAPMRLLVGPYLFVIGYTAAFSHVSKTTVYKAEG